jgi:hypothetical protein
MQCRLCCLVSLADMLTCKAQIVLSKPLIELCIKVEDQRDYFARIVRVLPSI